MSDAPATASDQDLEESAASTPTVLGATERLQQSRQLMRDQMLALNASSAQAHAKNHGSEKTSKWLSSLVALPVLGPLINTAMTWWAEHPLHAVAELFSRPSASDTEAPKMSLARRHPWAMLLSAAALGALLMWARPWRFALLRRAVYAGLLPQMVTTLLSRVSTDGVLDLVSSLLRPTSKPQTPTSATSGESPTSWRESAAPTTPLH